MFSEHSKFNVTKRAESKLLTQFIVSCLLTNFLKLCFFLDILAPLLKMFINFQFFNYVLNCIALFLDWLMLAWLPSINTDDLMNLSQIILSTEEIPPCYAAKPVVPFAMNYPIACEHSHDQSWGNQISWLLAPFYQW